MNFTDPHNVITPKSRLSDLDVVYSDSREGGWSAARLRWDGQSTLGLRWNGDSENPIGSPQSRGHPTWFIVPEQLQGAIEQVLRQQESGLMAAYQDQARDETGEAEALRWADATVGDAAGAADEAW